MSESRLNIAASNDIRVLRGDKPKLVLQFFDDNDQPITTITDIIMQARVQKSDLNSIKAWTIGNGLTLASNELTIDKFEDLPVGQFPYDIQVSYEDGSVFTVVTGTIYVEEDVSR